MSAGSLLAALPHSGGGGGGVGSYCNNNSSSTSNDGGVYISAGSSSRSNNSSSSRGVGRRRRRQRVHAGLLGADEGVRGRVEAKEGGQGERLACVVDADKGDDDVLLEQAAQAGQGANHVQVEAELLARALVSACIDVDGLARGGSGLGKAVKRGCDLGHRAVGQSLAGQAGVELAHQGLHGRDVLHDLGRVAAQQKDKEAEHAKVRGCGLVAGGKGPAAAVLHKRAEKLQQHAGNAGKDAGAHQHRACHLVPAVVQQRPGQQHDGRRHHAQRRRHPQHMANKHADRPKELAHPVRQPLVGLDHHGAAQGLDDAQEDLVGDWEEQGDFLDVDQRLAGQLG
eukprot:m.162817 g.162817  ORF g.162817 m.162817 type:complete len:340 (+) comp17097_c5_seq2:877-1896(+)